MHALSAQMPATAGCRPRDSFGTALRAGTPPPWTNLGFGGCDVWFDPDTWLAIHQQLPQSSWTFTLPLPNVPELAGWNFAMQAIYLPGGSPIGLDLSNAVWGRLGF